MHLSEALSIAVGKLASADKSSDLGSPDALDLVGDGQAVKLASESGDLIGVNLALDELDVTEDGVNLGSRSLARASKVVGILDGALEDTLVLLDSVLSGLLGLLRALAVGLSSSLGLLSSLLVGELLGLGVLLGLLLSGLLLQTLLVLGGVGLLTEALDALIASRAVIEKLAETGVVLSLLLLAGVGVLALDVALLVARLAIIRNILIEVLEAAPAVEVVEEVVELVNLLLGGVDVTERGNGVDLGEAALGLEDLGPQLVVVALLQLLLGGGLDIGLLVDGVVLAALGGVEKDLGGLLDALEELVVLGLTGGSLLVGVVLENLLAVSLLDLLLSGSPAVLGDTEDLVVVLGLRDMLAIALGIDIAVCLLTFQSLASRWSIMGSSGSLISPSSTSSTLAALSWAWMRSSSEKVRLWRARRAWARK